VGILFGSGISTLPLVYGMHRKIANKKFVNIAFFPGTCYNKVNINYP
jgi:hypothetical protein